MKNIFRNIIAKPRNFLYGLGCLSFLIATPSYGNHENVWGYKFTNNCRYPVEILIRYKDYQYGWQTEGWWTVLPNRAITLADKYDNRLLSSNSVFYYYGKTPNYVNRQLTWTGNRKISYRSKSYYMKEVTDTVGVNNVALACD